MTNNLPGLPPEWRREPRSDGTTRPGRNTKQEETYATNFNGLRNNYGDALGAIETLESDLQHERASHGNTRRALEISEGQRRELQKSIEKLRTELNELLCVAGIWAHLSLLMPESEVVRDPKTKNSYRFSNRYGAYEIHFSEYTGFCTLKVTPATDAIFNQPFQMALLKRQLEPRDIADLRGRLDFTGAFLPNAAKKTLQVSERDRLKQMLEGASTELQAFVLPLMGF